MREKHWLIIYDIRDRKRLSRVARKMSGYAVRVQKSVFEAIAPESVIRKLRSEIRELIQEEDFVVYFDVCERDWQKQIKLGCGHTTSPDSKQFQVL